jgi:hypothetical protein
MHAVCRICQGAVYTKDLCNESLFNDIPSLKQHDPAIEKWNAMVLAALLSSQTYSYLVILAGKCLSKFPLHTSHGSVYCDQLHTSAWSPVLLQ